MRGKPRDRAAEAAPRKIEKSESEGGDPILLTRVEVGRLIGLSERTVSDLEKEGVLRPIRIGVWVRHRRIDIEEWIADGCPRGDNRRKRGNRPV